MMEQVDSSVIPQIASPGATIGKNALWLALSRSIGIAISLITTPVFLAHFGADIYGIYISALTLMGFMGMAQLGVGVAMPVFLAKALAADDLGRIRRLISTGVAWSLCSASLCCAIVVLFAHYAAVHILHAPTTLVEIVTRSLWLCGAGLALDFVVSPFQALPQATQRFEIGTGVSIIIDVCSRIVALIVVILGGGVVSVLLIFVVAKMLTLPLWVSIAYRLVPQIRPLPRFYRREFKDLFRLGSYQSVSEMLQNVAFRLDVVLVARYSSLAEVTYYSIPMTACRLLNQIPNFACGAALPAVSARMHVAPNKVRGMYLRQCRLTSVLASPGLVVAAVAAQPLLHTWLRHTPPPTMVWCLSALGVAYCFQVLSQLQTQYAQAADKNHLVAAWSAALAPVYAGMLLMLVPHYGARGAAGTFLSISVGGCFLYVGIISRAAIDKTAWKPVLRGVLSSLSIALVTLGAVAVVWRITDKAWLVALLLPLAIALYWLLSRRAALIDAKDVSTARDIARAFLSSLPGIQQLGALGDLQKPSR